jgi:xanthine dehydrogenase YagS FAD-binding subunit
MRTTMVVIRDVMPPFELYQPQSVEDALALLSRYGTGAWVLAGGMDSLEWFKDRVKRPKAVVDLSRVSQLRGVREEGGGLVIGAMTTLAETATHPAVRKRFSLLSRAAAAAASPQIRNRGTLGGNVSQDTRCWYYRNGWMCYRAGGNTCYADTPVGMNREHAIFDAGRCVAVSPSDTAPAMVALEARMVIRNRAGTREVPAQDYFIGPAWDITRMTVLSPGDILTEIRIPPTWAGAQFYFEKVRDRRVWDFPLVNIAMAAVLSGERIQRARLAVNAVAAHPVRLTRVENALAGGPRNEATAEIAAALAAQGAVPLRHNGYKVALVRNLVKRAVRGQEQEPWA